MLQGAMKSHQRRNYTVKKAQRWTHLAALHAVLSRV